MVEETYVDENDEDTQTAILLFLAVMINRVGGQVDISAKELDDNVALSAIRFVTTRDEDGEPQGVALKTLSKDRAAALKAELNL